MLGLSPLCDCRNMASEQGGLGGRRPELTHFYQQTALNVTHYLQNLFFSYFMLTHTVLMMLTLQMEDTDMSEELRCTAWCHIHHLPLCDRASGPEWDGF